MTGAPVYATREMTMDALDTKVSAYQSFRIDRALEGASRDVESLCHRIFYPLTATKSWPWPNDQNETFTLWLDANEISSLTTLTSGGTTIPAAGYYLEPNAYGPPYDRIEINRGANYSFSAASGGPQRSITASGVFMGCALSEEQAGTAGAVNASVTSFTLTPAAYVSLLGVGSILRIDSERLLITERAWTASGQTGSLTASVADQVLTVSDSSVFMPRETLLIDGEMLSVLALASSTTLLVKRAVQGSVLAAHVTASISWSRTFIVQRGALGTTAASHSASAPVWRYQVPGLIEQLTIAYALDRGLQEVTGYARVVGSGDTQFPESGRGIMRLEKRVRAAHGRMARFRSV